LVLVMHGSGRRLAGPFAWAPATASSAWPTAWLCRGLPQVLWLRLERLQLHWRHRRGRRARDDAGFLARWWRNWSAKSASIATACLPTESRTVARWPWPGTGAPEALPARGGRRAGQRAGAAELPMPACRADPLVMILNGTEGSAGALSTAARINLLGCSTRRAGHLLHRVGPVLCGPERHRRQTSDHLTQTAKAPVSNTRAGKPPTGDRSGAGDAARAPATAAPALGAPPPPPGPPPWNPTAGPDLGLLRAAVEVSVLHICPDSRVLVHAAAAACQRAWASLHLPSSSPSAPCKRQRLRREALALSLRPIAHLHQHLGCTRAIRLARHELLIHATCGLRSVLASQAASRAVSRAGALPK